MQPAATDSTTTTATLGEAATAPLQARHKATPTPKDVIGRLPKDATPWQQDSAIQANFKPAPIHWSSKPDTLHMPGQPAPRTIDDVMSVAYYKESFFSSDSLYHPELKGTRPGVPGDPVPYTLAGDNLITAALLACFVFGAIAMANSRHFVARQIKEFFRTPRTGTTTTTETAAEVWFQLLLGVQTCLLFGIVYFFFSRTFLGDTFTISQYSIIGIDAALFAAFFLVKAFLYLTTGWVFFDAKKTRQWIKSFLFLTAMEGLLLYPATLLLTYFHLSIQAVAIYALFLIVLVEILTLYKTFIIFFKRMSAFLQIFLYFCALEIIPLLAVAGALAMIGSELKINF